MNKILYLPVFLLQAFVVQAAWLKDTCTQETWVTDLPPHAIVPYGDRVYIGGGFTHVGPYTGCWVPVDSSTGAALSGFPKIHGYILAVCADGNGGWFVGGGIHAVEGVQRRNIAHVFSDGSLDPDWNPGANSPVYSFARIGNTLYAGGVFDTIGGKHRKYIAALDAATGNTTDWNPCANSNIYTLAAGGSALYAGGVFDTIGGQCRHYIAALDTATGLATDWNPRMGYYLFEDDYIVKSIAVNGSTIYVGGWFDTVGGQKRSCIAALDAETGLATDWNPCAHGEVYFITVSGSLLYVGGQFDSIGGRDRRYIAALDAGTGLATDWNPCAHGIVNFIAKSGSTVYAGGEFDSIGGLYRKNIAALDANTGKAASWNPNVNGKITSIAVSGTNIYAGGYLSSAGGVNRNGLAALDAATGMATSWNPGGERLGIIAMAASGSTVYVGGVFKTIGGKSRNNIAALDAATGLATDWDPNSNGKISSIAVNGTTIYAGGTFTTIGGQSSGGIAALDSATGLASTWNPHVDGDVTSIALIGTTIYINGSFISVGGERRNMVAALDAITGNVTSWNPNLTFIWPHTLAVSTTTIYVGGDVGADRNEERIVAFDATTGNMTEWKAGANHAVYSLYVQGNTVFAGGFFDSIGGQKRSSIATLDAATGYATSWDPRMDEYPRDIYSDDHCVTFITGSPKALYVSGNFTKFGKGISHPYFAQFDFIDSTGAHCDPRRDVVNSGKYSWSVNGRAGAAALIRYELPFASRVSINVYNIQGKLLSSINKAYQKPGSYQLPIDLSRFSKQFLILAFKTGTFNSVQRIPCF